MCGKEHNKIYNSAADTTDMDPTPENDNRRGREGVRTLQKVNEENWEDLAEETALTKRQIAMWELAVRYDLKQSYIAYEYDVKESTVSRHVERVREKRHQVDEKIEELKKELQRWKKTKEYFESQP